MAYPLRTNGLMYTNSPCAILINTKPNKHCNCYVRN